jgi:Carboxypeptidase regulatory-like domain
VPEPFREEVAMRDQIPQQAETRGNLRMQVLPGQIGGYVTDPTGAVVSNAQITITSYDGSFSRTAVSDAAGQFLIVGLPSGNYKAMAGRTGFKTVVYNVNYNSSQPAVYDFTLSLGSTAETVEVVAQAPTIDTSTSLVMIPRQPQKMAPGAVAQNASENVLNLQKRVAGVLPVPIDVPRAGTSFSFVRPLVLDEETKVTFSYKSR